MARSEENSLTLGCAYWPRRKGPWFWDEGFDRGEVRGELEHVADLGCRLVRVLLPWATFQPQATLVNSTAFDRFEHVLDAAEGAGLTVVPTLFVGLFGGTRFVPRWLLRASAARGQALPEPEPRPRTISEEWLYPGAIQNFYEERALLEAQRFLIRELAGYFGPHPALAAWDLGGGDVIAAMPPRGPEAALAWLDHLTATTREADPAHPVWYGGQLALLLAPAAPRLSDLRPLVNTMGVSVLPFGHEVSRGPADEDFVLYGLQLAGTLAETGGTPLGCTGTGVPTAAPGLFEELIELESDDPEEPPRQFRLPSEEVQAEFIHDLLHAAYTGGVPFVFNLMYADPPADLWSRPPFDEAIALRRAGLVRADGREKPAAGIWRDIAGRLAHRELGAFGREARALDIDQDEFYRAPLNVFDPWYRKALEGEI